jgi:methionine aminotransferase
MFESKLPDVGTTVFTVMSELASRHGAVNLGQGFPDFDPPETLRRALARHVESGKNQYAPMPGLPELRARIAENLARCYGRKLDPGTEITVTSGATEAIFDAIVALVRPGDEVVLLDPSYDSYEPAVRLAGGNARHVQLRLSDFTVDWQAVAAAIGRHTRLLILNFPHNPSGAVLSPADLDELEAIVERSGIYVLSDEVYEHIVFDGREHQSVLRRPALAAHAITVSSFGKSFHATGWKVGFATACPELTRELRKVHQFVTFSTNTAAQYALAEVLEKHPEHLTGLAAFYQAKRDRFRELIADSGFRLLPVAGAYFQLVDYAELSSEDDVAFARRLTTEHGVAAIPLSPFYATAPEARIVRFCFCKEERTLELAAERLRKLRPRA